MSLIANARISIELGLADYDSGEENRLISAVRNFHAGVLLLLKEKLLRLSPQGSNEVLIKQKIVPKFDPSGLLIFVGAGKKTVDVEQIKERFKDLGIAFDWERFKEITNLRNQIEHYFTQTSRDAIRGLIANTFILVRDFVSQELQEEPLQLLGAETWEALLEKRDVFEKEKRECVKKIEEVDWGSSGLKDAVLRHSCCLCGSDLLVPDDCRKPFSEVALRCRSCGGVHEFQDYASDALDFHFAVQNIEALVGGGNPGTVSCPFCLGDQTYIVSEQKCALCGEEAVHECSRCGSAIPPEEIGAGDECGFCKNAWQNLADDD